MDTEDRQAFDKMKEINKPTAKGFTADNLEEALEASEKIGFPLMIRSARPRRARKRHLQRPGALDRHGF